MGQSSLDETLFPLETNKKYSAKELYKVLLEERKDYSLSLAANWGTLKKDRSTRKLKYGQINHRFLKTLEAGLENSELHSLELEFVRKGIELDAEYVEFVDFWYELRVDNGRQKTYQVTSYAVSNRFNDFIEVDLLRPKKQGPRKTSKK